MWVIFKLQKTDIVNFNSLRECLICWNFNHILLLKCFTIFIPVSGFDFYFDFDCCCTLLF